MTDWLPFILAGALGLFVGIVVDAIIKRRLLNTLYDAMSQSKEREDELVAENESLEMQEQALESALASLGSEESRLKSEIRQLKTVDQRASFNDPAVSQNLEQIERDRAAVSTERVQLEQRLSAAEGDSVETEIGIRFLQDEIERLTVQHNAIREEITNKRSDLATHAQKELDLSPQLRALTKEITQLELQSERLLDEKLESEVTRLTDKVQRLQSDIAILRGKDS